MALWQIAWFTVACAIAATVLVVPPGVTIAWVLARRRFPGRSLIETLVSLPLVLPPVAVVAGLFLLAVPRRAQVRPFRRARQAA